MRPFWIHQLVEYLIGVALIAQGMQDPSPVVPTVAGVLIVVNAAAVRGPLGAFKFIGRKLHRWLDLLVGAALAFGACQPWVAVEFTGRAILLAVLLPLGFSWYYTDWEERAGRRSRRSATGSDRSEELGKSAGRVAANAWLAGKRAVKKRSES